MQRSVCRATTPERAAEHVQHGSNAYAFSLLRHPPREKKREGKWKVVGLFIAVRLEPTRISLVMMDGAHWLISSNLSLTRFSADGYIHTYRRGTAATFGMVNLTRVFLLLLILILILTKRRLKSRIQNSTTKTKKEQRKQKEEPYSRTLSSSSCRQHTQTHTLITTDQYSTMGCLAQAKHLCLFLPISYTPEYGRPWRMVFKKTLDTLFFFIKKRPITNCPKLARLLPYNKKKKTVYKSSHAYAMMSEDPLFKFVPLTRTTLYMWSNNPNAPPWPLRFHTCAAEC